ncbi:MAG: LysM peptidoglycan-binding domain-containing protein [Akkermansiaceae bacterium]
MKPRELPVKRQPVKKGLFRILHAKIKRPVTAAAANPAELDGDIPRMKNVGTVLIVIALIHVAGVLFFFIHRYKETNQASQSPGGPTPSQKPLASAAAAVSGDRPNYGSSAITSMTDLPQIERGDDRHMVLAGDTYASVARKWNINEQKLRSANNNVDLCSGLVLRVPPREIVAIEPEEMQRLRNGGKTEGPSPRALLVRPSIDLETAPRATPVSEQKESSEKTYKVRQGDTFYKIARDNQITVKTLMSHNGITSEKSLKIGQTIKIPTTQY